MIMAKEKQEKDERWTSDLTEEVTFEEEEEEEE